MSDFHWSIPSSFSAKIGWLFWDVEKLMESSDHSILLGGHQFLVFFGSDNLMTSAASFTENRGKFCFLFVFHFTKETNNKRTTNEQQTREKEKRKEIMDVQQFADWVKEGIISPPQMATLITLVCF